MSRPAGTYRGARKRAVKKLGMVWRLLPRSKQKRWDDSIVVLMPTAQGYVSPLDPKGPAVPEPVPTVYAPRKRESVAP